MRVSTRIQPTDDFIRYALDSAAIVATTDIRGTITYVNSKFCEISGYAREELLNANHRMLKSGNHDMAFFRAMYRDIAKGKVWQGEICNRRKDGSLYWVHTTIVPHVSSRKKVDSYTSIRFDITERKQLETRLLASEETLRRIADIDPHTDLPNRRCFQEHIGVLIADNERVGRTFYLAVLDVDMFKEVNDSFGHPAGDELLATIANRLRAIADKRIFIARLGGDEFGVIFADATKAQAAAFFEQALEAIRMPIPIADTMRRSSASLGVAAFPFDGKDASSIFKAADLALYRAKGLGRDRVEFFVPSLRQAIETKSCMLAEIEEGLHHEAFELHYQPIVPLAPGRKISLEALMRWRHPERGLLMPASFQEAFDDQQVRCALGMYMLERAFRDFVRFRDGGLSLARMSLNLTNSDFRSDVFLDRFFELCEMTGLGPDRFCVEVTEGMFLGLHHRRVDQGLRRLHAAGVAIALDDFGTGFASLTHLRQLPITSVKIDRSFVSNMVVSKEDQAIVRGVIEIAHSLGALVVAEGVETFEQVEMLTDLNCDLLQGWYFGRATEAARLADILSSMPSARPKAT